jgi:hypothetical protein
MRNNLNSDGSVIIPVSSIQEFVNQGTPKNGESSFYRQLEGIS